MNLIIEAMENRRSIRRFRPELLDCTDVDKIIEAGLYAANGMGKQATKIICVTNKKIRDELSEMNRKIGGWKEGFDPFYGAPVVLIVLGQKDWVNHVYDGSLVMGNLMLASHALGYGSCWIHRAKEEFETAYGKELLQKLSIEGEWEGIGHCVIGYPDGNIPKAAKRKEDRVYYVE
jgi:hypothetical protein